MRLPQFMPFLFAGFGLLSVLSWGPVHADAKLYRWVDAQGHVHFGDQPTADARSFDPHLPHAGIQPALKTDSAECSKDKAQLARYREAGSITETDALGKTHVYSAAEKQKLLDLTLASVSKNCGIDAGADRLSPSNSSPQQRFTGPGAR